MQNRIYYDEVERASLLLLAVLVDVAAWFIFHPVYIWGDYTDTRRRCRLRPYFVVVVVPSITRIYCSIYCCCAPAR